VANAAGRLTRHRIIDAAERLFVERGVDAVPLREIGDAAGQRNVAAINYHFGGRDGLVRAIFDDRLATLIPRQRAMLDEVLERTFEGSMQRQRGLLAAFTTPMFELAARTHFLGFIARLQVDFVRADEYIDAAFAAVPAQIFTLLGIECPTLEPEVFGLRASSLQLLTVHALATYRRVLATGSESENRRFLADLLDVQVGILRAPSSGIVARTGLTDTTDK
jgi:AcrR family transcriptional regulator